MIGRPAITKGQDIKILTEPTTVAVQADIGEYRIGDRLQKRQCLYASELQREDVSAGREIVNRLAGERRSSVVSHTASGPLISFAERAGLVKDDAAMIVVGNIDRKRGNVKRVDTIKR